MFKGMKEPSLAGKVKLAERRLKRARDNFIIALRELPIKTDNEKINARITATEDILFKAIWELELSDADFTALEYTEQETEKYTEALAREEAQERTRQRRQELRIVR